MLCEYWNDVVVADSTSGTNSYIDLFRLARDGTKHSARERDFESGAVTQSGGFALLARAFSRIV